MRWEKTEIVTVPVFPQISPKGLSFSLIVPLIRCNLQKSFMVSVLRAKGRRCETVAREAIAGMLRGLTMVHHSVDESLKLLEGIISDFRSFLQRRGAASETDTRVKCIDRVLKEVCQWPEEAISREDAVESGHTDYQLRIRGVSTIAVEAKREGTSFVLPLNVSGRLKIEWCASHGPRS